MKDLIILGAAKSYNSTNRNTEEIETENLCTAKTLSKNYLQYFNGTIEKNGVTMVAKDGTYTLNGTAEKGFSFDLPEVYINAGTYSASGGHYKTEDCYFALECIGAFGGQDFGEDGSYTDNTMLDMTLEEDDYLVKPEINIYQGAVFEDTIFRPMLYKGANTVSIENFEPWADNVINTTGSIKEFENKIGNLSFSVDGNELVITDGTHTWKLTVN